MSLQPSRLVVESVPVAAILLFWNLLAWIVEFQNIGGPVRTAGTVMATLYVTVRGVSLASKTTPPAMMDVESVVRENARLAVPAGAWFVAAMVLTGVDGTLSPYPPTPLTSVVATAIAGAGLGVVGLYAVAAGTAALRRDGGAVGVSADD
ncbi:hypothetical protein [Halorussus litoreus]|uniref:hypothetical protein n=1 Tax=Halorussus litoreus TaxID=1710536 RepID=UPI000E23F370|nr:hypothetical protein [Halorussus litoreus]